MDVAILISGRGSNMQALLDACAADDFPANIVRVISNVPGAQGLERAKKAGVPTSVIDHRVFPDRKTFDEALHNELKGCGAELVCLAGFMRILDGDFVNRWKGRMLNIHPSLLPAFKGLHTHERAIEAGVRFTGCTVHFVSPEMDDGPIILQAAIAINPEEGADVLGDRVLELEHKIYPQSLKLVAEGRARIAQHQVMIEKADFSTATLINPIISKD